MPTIKSLDEAAEITGVPRRTLQRWLNEGRLTPWAITGDRRRFVDLEEIAKLREPRPDVRQPQPIAKPPAPLALAVIVLDGRLLMTRRRRKEQVMGAVLDWNLVSGKIEEGETPEAAAVREVREEVGLVVRAAVRIFDHVHPKSPDQRRFYYIGCEITGGTPELVDHEENREIRWCTLEEADRYVAPYGGFAPAVREYLTAAMVEKR